MVSKNVELWVCVQFRVSVEFLHGYTVPSPRRGYYNSYHFELGLLKGRFSGQRTEPRKKQLKNFLNAHELINNNRYHQSKVRNFHKNKQLQLSFT